MIFLFFISVVLVYIGQYYWTRRAIFRHAWNIPGPVALPLIGNLINYRTFKAALFKDFLSYYNAYGGIYRIWAGHNLFVVVTDPDMSEVLLNMKGEIFPKPVFFDFFNVMFGRSIFFEGDYLAWKTHRKILNRVFQSGAMSKLTSCLYEKIMTYCDRLEKSQIQPVNDPVTQVFNKDDSVTISQPEVDDVSSQRVVIPESSPESVEEAMTEKDALLSQRVDEALYSWNCDVVTHAVFGLKFKPTEIDLICYVNKQFFKLFRESVKSLTIQIKCLQRFTAFQSRKAILETVTRLGMFNFFVAGRAQYRDTKLDDVKLADLQDELGPTHLDELGLFNVAGIETLTTACSAIMFLLSMHPEAQAKTYNELLSVLGEDYQKEPTTSQLEDLKYLDMVIKESLRLFPPGYVAPRRAMENVNIGNYVIPKGASILINISGIHRNPAHYPQPDSFIPERFTAEESLKRPRNCFVPFGNGPRKCIGQKFALVHLKMTFAVLLRRFELLSSERYTRIEDCVTAFRFVIEFKKGCYVKFKPRRLHEKFI